MASNLATAVGFGPAALSAVLTAMTCSIYFLQNHTRRPVFYMVDCHRSIEDASPVVG